MEELTQAQLQEAVRSCASAFAVFFYTPFCGTCKMAARMLDIVLAADPSLPVKQSNLNFTPGITALWRIRSVPCIAIVKEGRAMNLLYGMHSVDELYTRLKEELK